MCVDFCDKLIFINKFIKQNRINNLFYDIKYLGLHLSFNFSSFFFVIVNDFFYLHK